MEQNTYQQWKTAGHIDLPFFIRNYCQNIYFIVSIIRKDKLNETGYNRGYTQRTILAQNEFGKNGKIEKDSRGLKDYECNADVLFCNQAM